MIKHFHHLLLGYRDDEKGSTAVEFGLIAIAFLTLLFGIIESGRLLLTWNSFQYSFENASRSALVNATITEEEIQNQISAQLQNLFISPDNLTIDVEFSTSGSGINFVDISGTYDYEIIVPLLPSTWNSIQLTAHSRLPR